MAIIKNSSGSNIKRPMGTSVTNAQGFPVSYTPAPTVSGSSPADRGYPSTIGDYNYQKTTGVSTTGNAGVSGGSGGGSGAGLRSDAGQYLEVAGGNVDYANQIAALYAQQQSQIQALYAQQRAAAEQAYQRGMNALEGAYNSKIGALGDNYNSTQKQLYQSHDYSKGNVEQDAAKSLQEAYLNKMLSQKNFGQVMSAQGLGGGMAESSLAKLENNYGNSRNNINTTTNRNISDLGQLLNENLSGALQQYNLSRADADSEKMMYVMQLEQALANNQISSTDSMVGALSSLSGNYMSALQDALEKQAAYQYTPTKANNAVAQITAMQNAAPEYGNQFNKWLEAQRQASAQIDIPAQQLFNLINSDAWKQQYLGQ